MKDYFQGEVLDLYNGEVKEERLRKRNIILWIMAALLIALPLLFWAKKAFADTNMSFVYPGSSNKVTLFQEPCRLGEWFKDWKRAVFLWNEKTFDACWRLQRTQQGMVVYTIDADGEVGEIPAFAFKKDEGV